MFICGRKPFLSCSLWSQKLQFFFVIISLVPQVRQHKTTTKVQMLYIRANASFLTFWWWRGTKTAGNRQLVARVCEYLHCWNVSLRLYISQLTSGKRVWRRQMSEAARGCNYVHLVAPFCVTCVIANDCVPALFFFLFPSPLLLCALARTVV